MPAVRSSDGGIAPLSMNRLWSQPHERQSGERAQHAYHGPDDQRLTPEKTADLARCGGNGTQQGQFSVALLDGERKGADDHEDRDEE